jgi:tRNA-guanine family transglycosylase
MEDMNCRLLLGNTYHLAYRPGAKILKDVGGIIENKNIKVYITLQIGNIIF